MFASQTSYSFSFIATDAAANPSAPQVVAITITEVTAPGETSPLTAPVLALAAVGDTYPPELSVTVDETYEEGDQIAIYSASSLAGTYTLLDTATLDATAISTGILTIADLSEISSPAQTWFKAYGKRTGEADSPVSNVIKHGDVTGPVITSDATQSQGEYEPMAYVITADEDIERVEIIGGTDAGLLEVNGTTIRLAGNADLNFNAKANYAFNFRTYDYGGNFTDTNAALNVSDEIPDAPVFVDDIGVERESAQSSNTYTLTGVTAGKNVPFTISLGTGCTYTLNDVSGLTAPSGTMQLGDTLSIQGTASDSYSTAIDTVFSVDGITDTYSISTMADPEAASLVFRQQGVMNYNYGTTCPGLTGDAIAIEDGDKVVIALFGMFNSAAGDFVITSVTANGGAITFTEVGEAFGAGSNNLRKAYLFYADTNGVTTISDLNVTVSGSTQDIGYSINSVQNAPAGGPADSHKNIRALSGEDPVSVDGGLSATDTRAMMICAQLSAAASKQFIWTGATEQDEKSESGRLISAAYQAPGQGAPVTLKGGSPDGVGYATLSQVNVLWGV